MSDTFVITFYNAAAEREYRKLDASSKRLVNIALRKLETRADEIGTQLSRELSG